jgi:hypothetical protein
VTWRGIVLGVLLGALFWGLVASEARAEDAPWWDDGWSARHRLELPRPGVEAVDAASAVMSTFGKLRPDGGDLRVVTARGRECPHELIQVGPGDQVSFLFETVVGERSYYAYFGNRFAEPPRATWSRTAGLLVEVRDLPEGPYRRAPEIMALWNNGSAVQGRALVSRVFHGCNPIGPAKKFIARYAGFLRVAAKGAYRVVTTSSDASAVTVNGRVVAQWGGDHNASAGRRGQFGSTLDLEPGLHKVEYYWV